jgi:hypothetical protein
MGRLSTAQFDEFIENFLKDISKIEKWGVKN